LDKKKMKKVCSAAGALLLCSLAPLHAQITLTSLNRQAQINTGADDGHGFQIDHPIGLTQISTNAGLFDSSLFQQASVSNAFASGLASQISSVLLSNGTLTVTGVLTTSGSVQVSSSPGSGFAQLLSDLRINFHLESGASFTLEASTSAAGSATVDHSNYVLVSSNSTPSFGYLNGNYPASGTISGTFPAGDQYLRASSGDQEAASPPYVPPVSMSQSRTQYLSFIFSVTPTMPRLSITRAGTNVVLSWPNFYTNFVLQTRASLSPFDSWVSAPGTIVPVGPDLVVTNAANAVAAFYRLMK
jgi:hypothetical protein